MKDFKKSNNFGSRDRGASAPREGGDRFPKRDFDSRPSFGRGPHFGGNKFSKGGDRDFKRAEMHKATCANCGKSCEVPFRPNGEKPVYCSDCFGANREREGGAQAFPKRDFGGRDERGGDRPESFRKPEAAMGGDKRIDELKRELDKANSKLDRLMDMVRASSRSEIPAVKETVKKEIVATSKPEAKPVMKKAVEKAEIKAPKKVEKKADKKVVAKKVGKKK
jgi:CxxC-x17-CxxC domain-containing protein